MTEMNSTKKVTATGRPITWYVDQEVTQDRWREEEVPAEIVGLTRPLTVFRAPRKTGLIAYDWHGDKETFCPPMWWDLAIGSGACGLGCRSCFLMLTHRIRRDPMRHLLYDNLEDFIHARGKARIRVKIYHSVVNPFLRLVPVGGAKMNSAERMSMNGTLELLMPLLHATFK